MPKDLGEISQQDQIDSSTTGWSKVPPVTRHYIAKPSFLVKPENIPDNEARRVVSIDFNSMASLGDVMAVLADQGLSSIITDDKISTKTISVKKFKGSVGQLLNAIAMSMDISFNWSNGVLLVGKTSDYMLSMTQDDGMLKKIQAEIAKLGASNVSVSVPTGTISFSASDKSRFAIEQYMNRAIKNAATINLQVAVISVALTNERSVGIDWSNLSATFNGGVPVPASPTSASAITSAANTAAATAAAATNATPGSAVTDAATKVVAMGTKATLDSTGLGLAFDSGSFTMKSLLSALSKYGNTTTDQNLLLKTLSGNKVKIESGSTTPYVSGVSAALGGSSNGYSNSSLGGGTTGGASNGVMGGAQTAKAKTGVTVDISPVYDADTNVVTLQVDLKLSSITGFVQLQAGAQLGTLTQPSTQDQSFNDFAKLQAGDTILLGGLILDHKEDLKNSLIPIESLPIGGENLKNRREALFIVIRPTSDVYEFSDTRSDNASFEIHKANSTPIKPVHLDVKAHTDVKAKL